MRPVQPMTAFGEAEDIQVRLENELTLGQL
jgi:hypothetical protein